jgi:Restriction endonuclease NaeI
MHDQALKLVAEAIQQLDPQGHRTAATFRETLDQLYDGQRTGRYRWDQLHKTEKTHCGTLVEINLQRHFLFKDGHQLDFLIGGVEVDCKYSQKSGAWMIPPEALGQLCLLAWASDEQGIWSLGLVRAARDHLNLGANRDGKMTLNEKGRSSISWLFRDEPLPPNALLKLDVEAVSYMMSIGSGANRVRQLFRLALGMRVSRTVVATVAQQEDYMKRVRENGGARTALRPEGIVILGQYKSHREIAQKLGVEAPQTGEFVSIRVIGSSTPIRDSVFLQGKHWRVASPDDPATMAPLLPKV